MLIVFVIGMFSGIFLTICSAIYVAYVLSSKFKGDSKLSGSKNNSYKEAPLDVKYADMANHAINQLKRNHAIPVTSFIGETPESPAPSEETRTKVIKDLENKFNLLKAESAERYSDLKSVVQFVHELSTLFLLFSKETSKLALVARSYIKFENETFVDSWWNALYTSLDHTSQDQEWLSKQIEIQICSNLSLTLDKSVNDEIVHLKSGTENIVNLRDAIEDYDDKLKSRDRAREKLSNSQNNVKLMLKLQDKEQGLQEQLLNLVHVQDVFLEEMPKTVTIIQESQSICAVRVRDDLIDLSDAMISVQVKNEKILNRLKVDFASTQFNNSAGS